MTGEQAGKTKNMLLRLEPAAGRRVVTTPEVADLVIAGRALDLDTVAALDLLDTTAAEAALAATPPRDARDDPACQAAALLHGLVRHHPFRRGNRQVALAADRPGAVQQDDGMRSAAGAPQPARCPGGRARPRWNDRTAPPE